MNEGREGSDSGHLPSIAEVRAIGQPAEIIGRPSAEHWTGHLYMRRVSPYVTRLAIRIGIKPNAITGLMILLGLLGAICAAFPGVATAAVAFLLIQAYLLLDCVDGEVARYRGMTSPRGVYLDRLGHYVVESSLLIALGIRVADGNLAWVVAGMSAALLTMLEKAETDLVGSARQNSGLGPVPADATTMSSAALARGRGMARFLPIHLLTHAAEASFLILVAAVVDYLWVEPPLASRWLIIVLLVISLVMSLLHFVSIWNSHRLDAGTQPLRD